jgi:cytochrome c
MIMRWILGGALALGLLAMAATYALRPAEDPAVARGKQVYRICAASHISARVPAPHSAPPLDGIAGRPAAAGSFAYSDALRRAASEGLVWTDTALDGFIADPAGFLPGTSMGFAGLHDPADRADVIAFIHARLGAR